jgi:hypothetical protein
VKRTTLVAAEGRHQMAEARRIGKTFALDILKLVFKTKMVKYAHLHRKLKLRKVAALYRKS